MNASAHLARRFREVMLDGKWIANTNFKDQLSQVNRARALKTVGDCNSIAALTYHVNYYIEGILPVFDGGKLEIRDKYSFDLPLLPTEADWEALKQRLYQNAAQFSQRVEALSGAQLEAAFVDEKYGTCQRNIEGVIEHSYYHLGQIVLLRKLIKATPNE